MAKKWPEKVAQRSFIKEHSFPNGLYVKSSNDYSSKNYAKNCFNYGWTLVQNLVKPCQCDAS